jgi:magnesium transporter
MWPQQRVSALFKSVPKLLKRGDFAAVSKLAEGFRPADLANTFRHIERSYYKAFFDAIGPLAIQAEVLGELDLDIARAFLPEVKDDELLKLLREMSSDDAADTLELVSEERAQELLKALHQAGEDEVVELFDHDPESAAGLMTRNFCAIHEAVTTSEAIRILQSRGEDVEFSYYVYVVNDAEHLVGVVSLRQLVLSRSDKPLNEIMATDLVSVTSDTDQEDVARMVARYNFMAIPVVDHTYRLVGVVTVDDIIDVIRLEATEDILKMAGAGDELEQSSVWRAAKARLPWLMASFGGGIAAAGLIGVYEESIAKVGALAAFIPIVLGMGGNVGIQSATIVTRGLALGRIDTKQLGQVFGKELLISTISGSLYGLLLGVVAWARYQGSEDVVRGGLMLGATVGLSVAAAMVTAASIGATVPMLFARVNIDPALASGPFVTTAVDVIGILSYFTIASALLGL